MFIVHAKSGNEETITCLDDKKEICVNIFLFISFNICIFLHPRKPRHNPFHYTAFMQCNGKGYAWV